MCGMFCCLCCCLLAMSSETATTSSPNSFPGSLFSSPLEPGNEIAYPSHFFKRDDDARGLASACA